MMGARNVPLARQACVAVMGLLLVSGAPEASGVAGATTTESLARLQDNLRNGAREMFDHGWLGYMKHAFPADDLRPISCSGHNTQGGFGNTLVDNLDTLLVLGAGNEFAKSVEWASNNLTFDLDVRVHTFELTIRALGGLLSAHVLANAAGSELIPGYDGGLLRVAEDLGHRLMPAFETRTGIPLSWVNLRKGVVVGDIRETCTACATTLLLEMGYLSALTGNRSFGNAASRATRSVFDMRSELGVPGATLDCDTGQWVVSSGGIGAGLDSYYEYLIKAYLLFGDDASLAMFAEAYASAHAAMQIRGQLAAHGWLADIHMMTGHLTRIWVSSLAAFWPGMQTLFGHTAAAAQQHSSWMAAWKAFGWLPELFDLAITTRHPLEKGYPLRPELMESTFLLYSATGDSRYLHAGQQLQETLQSRNKAKCGFASVSDVQTGVLEDTQESFFLSETVKYLFLLGANASDLPNFFLLTTEGHLLPPLPSSAAYSAGFDLPTSDGADERSNFESSASHSDEWGYEGRGVPLPQQCTDLCRRRSSDERQAAADRLRAALPMVPFEPNNQLLLRQRRCRACLAVEAAMALRTRTDAASEARTRRSPHHRGQQDTLENSPHILRQILCRLQAGPQEATLCRQMSILQPGTPITSLPSDSIVIQVAKYASKHASTHDAEEAMRNQYDDKGPSDGDDISGASWQSRSPRLLLRFESGACTTGTSFTVHGASFGPPFQFPEHCWEGRRPNEGSLPHLPRGDFNLAAPAECTFRGRLVVADPVRGCSPLHTLQQGVCPLPLTPFDRLQALAWAESHCSVHGITMPHPLRQQSQLLLPVPAVALLMQRGECNFVTKVQHGAIAGASAVIIGNEPGRHNEVVQMGGDGGRVDEPPIPSASTSTQAFDSIRALLASAGGADVIISIEPIPESPSPDSSHACPRGSQFSEDHHGLCDSTTAGMADEAGEREAYVTQRDSPPLQHPADEQAPAWGERIGRPKKSETAYGQAAAEEMLPHVGLAVAATATATRNGSGSSVVGEMHLQADTLQTDTLLTDTMEHSRAGSRPHRMDHPAGKEGVQLEASPDLQCEVRKEWPDARAGTVPDWQSTLLLSSIAHQQEQSSRFATSSDANKCLLDGSIQKTKAGKAAGNTATASSNAFTHFAAATINAQRRHESAPTDPAAADAAADQAAAMEEEQNRQSHREKQHLRQTQSIQMEILIPPQAEEWVHSKALGANGPSVNAAILMQLATHQMEAQQPTTTATDVASGEGAHHAEASDPL